MDTTCLSPLSLLPLPPPPLSSSPSPADVQGFPQVPVDGRHFPGTELHSCSLHHHLLPSLTTHTLTPHPLNQNGGYFFTGIGREVEEAWLASGVGCQTR